jgi:hypothetical protein
MKILLVDIQLCQSTGHSKKKKCVYKNTGKGWRIKMYSQHCHQNLKFQWDTAHYDLEKDTSIIWIFPVPLKE